VADLAEPFIDPVRGLPCVAHFGAAPGVEHPDCAARAEVFPDLDAFWCRWCGYNGRINGAWFWELLARAFPEDKNEHGPGDAAG
jgi:hypothetical protein